jgi:hypothetical protein
MFGDAGAMPARRFTRASIHRAVRLYRQAIDEQTLTHLMTEQIGQISAG